MDMRVPSYFPEFLNTDVTPTRRTTVYPAISPTRPELTQVGRFVLVAGGGTGVGFAAARAFVRAKAAIVMIVGRRNDVLERAAQQLMQDAAAVGSIDTEITWRVCDLTNGAAVTRLWEDLTRRGRRVDVLVANVAKLTEPRPVLEQGADEVWLHFEARSQSMLDLIRRFYEQSGNKQRFLVNISVRTAHQTSLQSVAAASVSAVSMTDGTRWLQRIAQENQASLVQVVSFHPGLIYNDYWKEMGMSPDMFDNDELCGAYAVWAASSEAAFLHGRFTWAAWDVQDLATGLLRQRIESDPYFLRG